MIDLWAVVVLLVGVIMTFVGALLAATAANLRKPVDALHTRVDRHDSRLADLERLMAVQASELKSILKGIDDIKTIVRRHCDRHHEGETEL